MPLWWFTAVLGVLLEQPMTSGALNYQHTLEIFEENCSTALGIPISQSFEKTEQDTHSECPPWWYRDRGDSDGTCIPGPNLNFIGHNRATMQTFLQQCTCMTEEEEGILTAGGCLYTCIALEGIFPLPCHTSKLNNFTCEDLNRKGRLCGECKLGYAPPVYSYSLKCVQCKNYRYNWIKYLCVAFLPLTLFFLIVTIFSISFTSPQLSAVVIVYQEMASPTQLSILVTLSHNGLFLFNKIAVNILISLAGIWNLDFFRMAYTPFCLHPSMTTLHTQAMDYAIAIYPLVLIMVTYVMVTLYDRGIKLVKCIWDPILKISRKWKQRCDIRTSLIDAFASFIFLSATRLLSASFVLLVPGYSFSLNSINASQVDVTHYVFNAPSVVYFSWGHLPFAIAAIILLLFLNLLPMMLLFVYPLKRFQCLLNRLNLNSNSLRTFIDVFQGSFKDGTNGTRDYRFFSGFLLLIKFMFCATFWMTHTNVYYSVASVWILVYCSLVASCKPYKKMRDNYITIVVLATFLCYNAGITFNIILNKTVHPLLQNTYPVIDVLFSIAILLIGIGVVTPTLYLIGRVAVLTFMLVKKNRCV